MIGYVLIGIVILVVYLIAKNNSDVTDIDKYSEVAGNLMNENDQLKQKLDILEREYGSDSTNINYRRLYDTLAMPYRRIPSIVPDSIDVVPINVNTQGGPEPVQALGYITNGTDDQVLQLFGRKLYDDNYDYYTQTNDEIKVKIPIDTNNNQELHDDDTVSITPYNTKTWSVHLYEVDYPRYLPNVIY
jgi:hypothetical protein